MKVLVLTSQTITAAQLRGALGDVSDPASTEVLVVAPALAESPLKFWVSDTDEAMARANEVRESTVQQLSDEGVEASGRTGANDPLQAIQDALQTFPAERIVLFTRPEDGQRYREDVDEAEVRERFGLPVQSTTVE